MFAIYYYQLRAHAPILSGRGCTVPFYEGFFQNHIYCTQGIIPPPPWIRIFRSIKSTSRRTQAAAIAYMFPHCLGATKVSVELRHLTARNRTLKLDSTMVNVCCSPEFCNAAADHTTAFDRKVALVCDGGCDHNIPSSPPSNKVSIIVSIDYPPLIARTHTVLH